MDANKKAIIAIVISVLAIILNVINLLIIG
jgi:hypothetical protein